MYGCFMAVSRILLRVRVRGFENVQNLPGQLVAGTHKSDLDIVMVIPTLYWRHRCRGPIGRATLLAIEDLFLPGFVAGDALDGPAWLRRLLFAYNVGKTMTAMRWIPIALGRTRRLASHLREILDTHGDKELTEVFCDAPDALLPGIARGASVGDALRPEHLDALFRRCSFEVFREPIRSDLRARHRERIGAHLAAAGAVLDRGDVLVFSPQGLITGDGRIAKPKSGLSQIAGACHRDISVLPMGITYDSMRSGRAKAFLAFGASVPASRGLSREDLDDKVWRAMLSLTTVTLSQLAGRAICLRAREGKNSETLGALRGEVAESARNLAARGLYVDPALLSPRGFAKEWRRLVRFCRQTDALTIDGEAASWAPADILHPVVEEGRRQETWFYAANELEALLTAAGTDVDEP